VLALVVALLLWSAYQRQQRMQGASLFEGQISLVGRLVHHAEPLPALATRCSNCHDNVNRQPVQVPSRSSAGLSAIAPTRYAVELNRRTLTQPLRRRGGPESTYDAKAFCRLLRDGTDAAYVLVSTTMPRYDATEEQCASLWAYVTSL
jgi:hypothetical protein